MTNPSEKSMREARETVEGYVTVEKSLIWAFAAALDRREAETREEMFNISETEKSWQENFYESEWNVDTLNLTALEKKIIKEMTNFLPRHMEVYDWNLPYAEFIILIIRKEIAQAIRSAAEGGKA